MRFVHRRLNSQRRSLDTVVRFEGRTCSGYKPHPDGVDMTDGRTDLARRGAHGHYADYIYPNLTPLPYPTVLIMVRADPIAPDRTRLFSRIYGLDRTPEQQEADLENLAIHEPRGHRHGDRVDAQPALAVLPRRPADRGKAAPRTS